MFCRYCGKELANTAKFCRYCGKEVKVSPEVRGESSQATAPLQQETAGQNVTTQSAVTQAVQGTPQVTSQPANAQASAKTSSDSDGVLDVYIDGLKEKLAKTENPLLKGRSLGNVVAAVCWAFMVLSFFLPFMTSNSKFVGDYSGLTFLASMFIGIDDLGVGVLLELFIIFAIFFLMLFFIARIIYQNKNTIKSNRGLIIWSCVDFAYQVVIWCFINFMNEENKNSIFNVHAEPGMAVWISGIAAIILFCIAANAVMKLKEAQPKKENSNQNS